MCCLVSDACFGFDVSAPSMFVVVCVVGSCFLCLVSLCVRFGMLCDACLIERSRVRLVRVGLFVCVLVCVCVSVCWWLRVACGWPVAVCQLLPAV